MRWTPQSNAFSENNLMTSPKDRPVSGIRVPASTTETGVAIYECSSAMNERNQKIFHRCIAKLVHEHGWILGQDGNLYSPNPAETAWGERAV